MFRDFYANKKNIQKKKENIKNGFIRRFKNAIFIF